MRGVHGQTDPTFSDLNRFVVLDEGELAQMPWVPLSGFPGVAHKVLWRVGDIVLELLRYSPGATSPGEPHLAAHHHLWVQQGALTLAGRTLTAGSYVHIPPGVEHPVSGIGPEGCVVVEMYLPHAPQEAALRGLG